MRRGREIWRFGDRANVEQSRERRFELLLVPRQTLLEGYVGTDLELPTD